MRIRRAVEAEAFPGRQVVIGRNIAPEVDGRYIVADFIRFSEYGQPQEHFYAFAMQERPYAVVCVLVQAPSDDDLTDIDEGADRVYAVDYPRRGIIRGIPAAERHLYDI